MQNNKQKKSTQKGFKIVILKVSTWAKWNKYCLLFTHHPSFHSSACLMYVSKMAEGTYYHSFMDLVSNIYLTFSRNDTFWSKKMEPFMYPNVYIFNRFKWKYGSF